LQAVGDTDLGGAGAEAEEAGLGPLQHLHGHIVPVKTQLAEGLLDGLLLGPAGHIKILHSHKRILLLCLTPSCHTGPPDSCGPGRRGGPPPCRPRWWTPGSPWAWAGASWASWPPAPSARRPAFWPPPSGPGGRPPAWPHAPPPRPGSSWCRTCPE